MPEHENRLAELSYRPMTPEAAEELRRWLAIQDVLNEVAQERLAQIAQWGEDHVPPTPSEVEIVGWSRDDLVQLAATVTAMIQKSDRDRAAAGG